MKQFDIYKDINTRTGGDIYLGIVGPVRTGKSTFISKFMNSVVLPEMKDGADKTRAIDELPQSAAGKTVMTTEPKFVPNEAVKVQLDNNIEARFRLVDCVGYVIDGVQGVSENGEPRFVKTPWSDKEMPFDEAAEIGTKKVIEEHSTIAIVVTTDGTISGIAREKYEKAEAKVINELKATGKPFVVVLNTTQPLNENTQELVAKLEEQYDVKTLAVDILNMTNDQIQNIMTAALYEFPINKFNFNLPKWVRALDYDNLLIKDIVSGLKTGLADCNKMRDAVKLNNLFEGDERIEKMNVSRIELADGVVNFDIDVATNVFYQMISEQCGMEISDEYCLMSSINMFAEAKREFDKIKEAFMNARENGYGIVVPTSEEMKLEAPEVMKKSGGSGVKLKASAPSYHIMRVDVETEVSPAVGVSEQSDSFNNYLLGQVENNPEGIWNTNMFGKPLSSFVQDGIINKLANVPEEAQLKMRKTMTKIVNEGKGGIICILL